MKSGTIFTIVALIAATGLPASRGAAERIKEGSAQAEAEFDRCMDSGSAKVERKGVTSCTYNGGHGIICGGPKPEHQGTCDTFRRLPGHPKQLTSVEAARWKRAALTTTR